MPLEHNCRAPRLVRLATLAGPGDKRRWAHACQGALSHLIAALGRGPTHAPNMTNRAWPAAPCAMRLVCRRRAPREPRTPPLSACSLDVTDTSAASAANRDSSAHSVDFGSEARTRQPKPAG